MTNREEFTAWYLAAMIDLLGKGVESQARLNLDWLRDDGSFADPSLRLALMAWEASKSKWQPMENCPNHVDVLFYRADAGVFSGMITDADHFLSDKERDEWPGTEAEMFDLDAFGFGDWGVCRCDGAEKPTHWMPLPGEPEVKP